MSREFVIQVHSGYGRTHYDLMLSSGEALATWQLGTSPAGLAAGGSIPARRLGDHRRLYLSYRGAVSRDRGTVTPLDGGTYELLSLEDDRWEFRLDGSGIRGRFELARRPGGSDEWQFRCLEAD